ncbi:MAG TPA: hypothetical protein VN345_10490 [Blastocatellia bacterium]|nr:hypothetical protein [Blastocatellia bacterium]
MGIKPATPRKSPVHVSGRWMLLTLIFGAGVLYCLMATGGARPRVVESFRLLAELTVFAAAAVMGYVAARQFSPGQEARLSWMLISLTAALFFLADVGIYLPSVVNAKPVASAALLTAVAAITLSRVFLVWGLWRMARVYRASGLGFGLYDRDFGAMVLLAALNLLTLIFGANAVRFQLSNTGADLIHWILIICLPLPLGLIVCSVLAVIIWRYSQQMGGGLVAKAWQSVLLYTLLLPVRTIMVGLSTSLLDPGSRWAWVTGEISYLGLALAVWALYLGASYQYEACARSLTAEIDAYGSYVTATEPAEA